MEENRLELAEEYSKMESEAYEQYIEDWNRLQVLSLANIPTQMTGKLSDKEKTAIKEKFRKYNSTFDELITSNR